MINIIQLLNKLQELPVYHLSLADKELFHSNFLAWLGINPKTKEYFIHIIEVLIGNKIDWSEAFIKDDNSENFKVEREFRKFDLCILKKEHKNRGKDPWIPVLVLENKNKSIPYIEQLKNYSDTVLNLYGKETKNVTFILLSLAEDFVDKKTITEDGTWKIKTYCELHDAMSDNVSKRLLSRTSELEKSLINNYIEYIDKLHALATNLLPNATNCDYFLPDEVTKSLKEYRLQDLSEKLRYSKFAAELKNTLEQMPFEVSTDFKKGCADAGIGKVFVNSGYTSRGGGGGFFEVAVKIHKDYVLKIQVQGEYYRHVIEWVAECSPDKRSVEIDRDIFESLRDIAIQASFFRGDYESTVFWVRAIFEQPTNIMPTKNSDRSKSTFLWDCFNNFGDGFKYQYVMIKKRKVSSIDVLNAIVEDVKQITSIIDNFRNPHQK